MQLRLRSTILRSLRGCTGFTLMELSISLLVLSLLMGSALVMTTDILNQKKVKTDKDKLAVIEQAIEDYARIYGKLPCPASRTTTLGTSTFGRAVLGDCFTDTSVPAGTLRVDSGGGKFIRIGAVPARDLLIRDEYMVDSFGDRFTYVVTENLTSTGSYVNGSGKITVNDGFGNIITTKASYLVFSHGKDGKGSWRMDSGALKVACGSTANLDVENCNDNNATFTRTIYNDGNVTAKYFDDSLVYESKNGVAMCFRIDGTVATGQLGRSCVYTYGTRVTVASGDFNGDSNADLVSQSWVGTAAYTYVVFGSSSGIPLPLSVSSLNGSNGFVLTGVYQEWPAYGTTVAVADVNNDGYDDILLNESPSSAGQVSVVFGKPTSYSWAATQTVASRLNGTDGFKISVPQWNRRTITIGSGDINGDGIDDIVAAGLDNNAGVQAAVMYVVFGQQGWTSGTTTVNAETLTGTNGVKIIATSPFYAELWFGYSQIPTGDINGDGRDDIIVSEKTYGNAESRVYVIFGKASWPSGTTTLAAALNGTDGFQLNGKTNSPGNYDKAGLTLDSADMNADGRDDIIIGTGYDSDASQYGYVYVIYGQPTAYVWTTPSTISSYANGTAGYRLSGSQRVGSNNWGAGYAMVGNVNNDAYPDLLIDGSQANYLYKLIYVIYGKPGASPWAASTIVDTLVDGTQGFKLVGASSGGRIDEFGFLTADFNGDGYNEIVIGAQKANSDLGYIYGVLGKASGLTASSYDLQSYCAAP